MTRGNYRHTKIVATLGPATDSPEQLEKIILAGVDVIRLNMAHATEEWVIERVGRIRDVSARIGRHVAVMMDVKGPGDSHRRHRAADRPRGRGIFAFYTRPPAEPIHGVEVNYAGLAADVTVGAVMLVDSGLMRFEVVSKDDDHRPLPRSHPGPARLAAAHQSAGSRCESARAHGERSPRCTRRRCSGGRFFRAFLRTQRGGRARAQEPAWGAALGGAHHREDRGSGRRAEPRGHCPRGRLAHGRPGRSGDRDRLPSAAAGPDADRRCLPGPGQAGHRGHPSA